METLISQLHPWVRRFPFSTIVRWVFTIGVLFRFLATYSTYSSAQQQQWIVAIGLFLSYGILITVLSFRIDPKLISYSTINSIIIVDTLFSSVFIILSGLPESDLYLIYILPILLAVELAPSHLRGKILFAVIFVFSIVTLWLSYRFSVSLEEAIVRNWLPRLTLLIIMTSIVYKKEKETWEREAYQNALMAIAQSGAYNSSLVQATDMAKRLLRADGCKVYRELPNENALRLESLSGIPESDELYIGYKLSIGKGAAGVAFHNQNTLIVNNYSEFPERVPELETLFHSILSVPLSIDIQTIGIISVFDTSGTRIFNQADAQKLQAFGQFVSSAVYEKLLIERQQEMLGLLNKASESFNKNLDLAETCQSISAFAYQVASKHIQDQPLFTCVYIHRTSRSYLQLGSAFPHEYEDSLRATYNLLDLNEETPGIIVSTFLSNSIQKASDVKSSKNYLKFSNYTVSELAVPLKSSQGCIGVINFEFPISYHFSEDLIKTLDLFAQHATSAIENAVYSETQKRYYTELSNLHQAVIEMGNAIPEVARQEILAQALILTGGDRATLQRIVPDEDLRTLLADTGFDGIAMDPKLHSKVSGDDLVSELITNAESLPIVIPDVKVDNRWQVHRATEDVLSWVGLPLVYSDHVIGIVTVDMTSKYISENVSVELFDLFARHAASILRNTELLAETEEKVKELEEKTTYLEILTNSLDEYADLTRIGFVYGESIHFASRHLGAAKDDASEIPYLAVPHSVIDLADSIVNEINEYLKVLDEFHRKAVSVPEPTKLSIHETLDRVVDSKRYRLNQSKKSVDVTGYWHTDLEVNAPEKQLKQVFYVIVENAINAMRSGDTLSFTTRPITIHDQPYIEIYINDTGRGIPKHVQERLFEFNNPEERKETRRKGTGMGLPWARSFLRSYRGDITIMATSHKGTQIRVLVPKNFKSLWALTN